jgi:hypothetical protein
MKSDIVFFLLNSIASQGCFVSVLSGWSVSVRFRLDVERMDTFQSRRKVTPCFAVAAKQRAERPDSIVLNLAVIILPHSKPTVAGVRKGTPATSRVFGKNGCTG